MAFEDVMGAVARMTVAMEAIAAIGADLTIRTGGAEANPEITTSLGAVTAAAGVDLQSLAPPQQQMIANIIRLNFAQAADLLREPGRAPGWSYTDPTILEGIGRASGMIPTLLAANPELANMTSFLDVGAGVGWLAIAAANTWPQCSVVGIDIYDTALARARANVDEAGLADRITLRKQDVAALDDVATFDGAWLPTFFISDDILGKAVGNVVQSLRPGGAIVLGLFDGPPEPLLQATTNLRTIRGGGTVVDVASATDLLESAGCTGIRTLDRTMPVPMAFVAGTRA
jgi:SAM-dependent methyltransferase